MLWGNLSNTSIQHLSIWVLLKTNEDGVIKIIETLKPNIERLELESSSIDEKAVK